MVKIGRESIKPTMLSINMYMINITITHYIDESTKYIQCANLSYKLFSSNIF